MNIFLSIYEYGRHRYMLKCASKGSGSVGGVVVSIATFYKGLGKCTSDSRST